MMKYINHGLLFFRKHLFTYILMILQLAFLIIAESILIAGLNSRDVLYAPYEDIITKDGYFYSQPYGSGIWDENGELIKSSDEALNEILPGLRGDPKVYSYYTAMLGKGNDVINVRIIDDEIYNALMLPLDSGRHASSGSGKSPCLITKNDLGLGAGSHLEVEGVTLEISGVLTDRTYLPDYSEMSSEMSVQDLYQPYTFSDDIPLTEDDPLSGMQERYMDSTEVIAPLSAFEESIKSGNVSIFRSRNMLIAFESPLSEEDRTYNEKAMTAGDAEMEPNDQAWFISFEQINRKGLIYRNEDFNKMLPIVICIIIVIFIGVICSSAIISVRQSDKFAVLYLNGATPTDCLMVSCITALISSAAALIIALCVIALSTTSITDRFANQLGFVWGMNNTLAIIATTVFAVISFGMIPAVLLHRKRFMIKETV